MLQLLLEFPLRLPSALASGLHTSQACISVTFHNVTARNDVTHHALEEWLRPMPVLLALHEAVQRDSQGGWHEVSDGSVPLLYPKQLLIARPLSLPLL